VTDWDQPPHDPSGRHGPTGPNDPDAPGGGQGPDDPAHPEHPSARDELGGVDGPDDRTPLPLAERLWPPLVVVAATVVGWLVLLPWDWSTVDANGKATNRSDPWGGLVLLAVVIGLTVAAVVRRQPRAVLSAPLAGIAAMAVLYSWRASQARVTGGNAWFFGLIGVVIPIGLLGAFGGAFLAIRTREPPGR